MSNGHKSSRTVAPASEDGPAMLEHLESRVLLSETPVASATYMKWHGVEVEVVEQSWIVSFDDYLGEQAAINRTAQMLDQIGAVATEIRAIGRGRWSVFTTNAKLSESTVSFIQSSNADITNVEPNRVYHPLLVPNDPDFDVTWQLENTGQDVPGAGIGTPGADIHALEAWDQTTGTHNQIVAVIDTGVDLQHPDLIANIWTNPGEIAGNGIDDDGNGFIDDVSGWDFGSLDNNPDDEAGHGTSVAGTIGAVGNNGIGTVGVAWSVSILPIKIANDFGGLVLDAIIGAHDYLTMLRGLGVNIVASNNSYGAFAPDFFDPDEGEDDDGFQAEEDAIQAFIQSGATFVAAAGNDSNDNDLVFTNFPASYDIPGIIAVAASDNNDGLASFSNFGATEVDLAAPGDQIYTTSNGGGYEFTSGTSFASPIVAGAVALLKAVRPQASAVQIRQALLDGVDVLPAFQGKVVSNGRLNLAKSLAAIQIAGPIVTAINPGPITGTPVNELVFGFNKTLDAATLDMFGAGAVTLFHSGGNDLLGDGNDVSVPITMVTLSEDARSVTITPGSPLGEEFYRVTLDWHAFKDTVGNFLNGNTVSGIDETYDFQAVSVSIGGEPNDSILQSTALNFNGSGTATIVGATIGDGVHSNLDVDIYRLTVPIGGLITAQIDAKSLPSPSSLDSYLRLFDAGGNEITANDQFNNTDSFIQFFVTTGGVYYLGVSGFPNTSYNPNLGGSGTSQSTGVYNMTVTVDLIEDDVLNFADTLIQPAVIPDGGQLVDQIVVEDGRTIQDVNLFLNVTHSFMSDITMRLFGPDGTSVLLASKLGADGQGYIGTAFDDSAGVSINAGAPPFTGTFRPAEPLAAFKGRSAAGVWSLVITDEQALNAGMLTDWALEITVQNDIFGPFELNDTLSTATPLGISGNGVATRVASIGDGGFGFQDVDIYQFVANPGSTLNATVDSLSVLNTALRLFDANGNPLALSNPGASRDSAIDSFTFVAGGVYYLGVSETANTSYDPVLAASGPAAGSTGSYRLSTTVTAGVADSEAVLDGNNVDAFVDADGTIGSNGLSLRFGGIEILTGGEAFYGAVFNGVGFKNDSTDAPEVPVAITDESDGANSRMTSVAIFNGLQLVRSISFGDQENFMVFDVSLTNTTGTKMESLAWMEAINPTPGGEATTENDVDGLLATASKTTADFPLGFMIAMGVADSETRAIATVVDPLLLIRDPQQVLNLGVVDPDGNSSNGILTLAYDLGDLEAGQTTSLRYFVFMGEQPADVQSLYAALNDGTGGGNLTADSSNPAVDEDGFALLPYKLYHPEGFANKRASTFIPLVNSNNADSRVVIIARYEFGDRDELLFDGTVKAHSRDGITITTPALFEADEQLVRKNTPYAIEIRSELPIGATLSHFDFGVTTGESFTSTLATTWSFARVTKGPGHSDFVVFYNSSNQNVKVDTTFFPEDGGTPIKLTQQLGPLRRGGWGLAFQPELKAKSYGVLVESTTPIVVAVSSFDSNEGGGYGALGAVGIGTTNGALPEGQFGLNTNSEVIPVLNTTGTDAEVEFSFLFENGSAVRETITVVGGTMTTLDVASLPAFPAGQPYAIIYESTVPVSVALPTASFAEINGSSFTGDARSVWLFSDGFRPAGNTDQVTEYLRIYNPAGTDVLVEITLLFLDGTTETVKETVGPRRVAEFDPHDIVPLAKRGMVQFYGLMVKGASPVSAYMGRSDNFFSGAFGTLGTPLGVTEVLF
jgi:subtilisin family serine protease/subtilisin-like proprotein convertase family protein